MQSGGGSTPILPSEYQQVEWIGLANNTTTPYIYLSDATLTKADLANYELHFTMGDISDPYNSGVPYVGIVIGASTKAGCYFCSRNGLIGMGYDSITSNSSTPKRDYVMKWNSTGGRVEVNGEIVTQRVFTSMDGGQRFYLGTGNRSNTPLAFKCYGAKIVYNGTTVNLLIPCYRKSDGVIGMYDTGANKLRINEGSGAFVKGTDVN